MKVRDVMTESVFRVTPDTSLKTVAARMLEYGISGMPVVEGERLLGVVSETDILFKERVAPERKGVVDWLVHYAEDPPRAKLEARTAGEAMTSPAVTIGRGRSVADAAALMLDLRIDRLPVVDGEELVGIVTRADLVRAFTRDDEEIELDIRQNTAVRRLWRDPEQVQVAVQDGHVVLSGMVETAEQAESLVAFVQSTPGVVSVESRLS